MPSAAEAAKVVSTVRRFGINYDKPLIFDRIHHEINQVCSKSTLQDVRAVWALPPLTRAGVCRQV